MNKKGGQKSALIIIAIMLNVIAIYLVITSVVSSINQFHNSSFTQNVENIKTLTDSSANKVDLVVDHYTQDVKFAAAYMDKLQRKGMNINNINVFFQDYFGDAKYDWQLIDNVSSGKESSVSESFSGTKLAEESLESVSYKVNSYPEHARVFSRASEDTLTQINYINEYTDVSTLQKSFAICCYVRVLTYDEKEQRDVGSYKTLLLVVRSDDINQVITTNNTINNLDFYDYANVIIDKNGNYVFSNDSFQGKNFLRYLEEYDDTFTKEKKEEILDQLSDDKPTDPIYYKNSKGQDCIYSASAIQNTDWYILSSVPIESFHNVDHYSENYIRFFLSFVLLFVIDFAFILSINHQLRRKTKEAETANIAKSKFLSSMSHDIRTPMNAIIGMTLIAEDHLQKEPIDKKALEECVKTIALSGKHLVTLVNDILDISKIESGKIVLSETDFSIEDTIKRMLEILQPQMQDKNLNFESHMENITAQYVHADQLRMNQIFINILSNAIKYTNPGGTVKMELLQEAIPERTDVAKFIYRVSDNGIGISEEFQKTIFEQFTRAVDTRINRVQGTGLGLSIVKQLVDLMNGTISVQSELNVGSVFTVELVLPLVEPQIEDKTIESIEEHPHFDLQVLVAEDNLINWRVIETILQERYGVKPERAENGKRAVEMVSGREKPYDLILMDVQMPIMDGYEAARKIRGLSDTSKAAIPIYAMTADTFAEDVTKCLENGMNGHLAKPIDMDKLLAILKQIQHGE